MFMEGKECGPWLPTVLYDSPLPKLRGIGGAANSDIEEKRDSGMTVGGNVLLGMAAVGVCAALKAPGPI